MIQYACFFLVCFLSESFLSLKAYKNHIKYSNNYLNIVFTAIMLFLLCMTVMRDYTFSFVSLAFAEFCS